MIKTLQEIERSPEYILTCTKDAFGEELLLEENSILFKLRKIDNTNAVILKKTIKSLATAFISKIELQLGPYLPGGSLERVHTSMLEDTVSAPPHNIYAERSLGMVDAMWRRAPKATLGFMEGKVKGAQNKTLEGCQTDQLRGC